VVWLQILDLRVAEQEPLILPEGWGQASWRSGHVGPLGLSLCPVLMAAVLVAGALLQEERLDAVTLLYATSLPSFCLLVGAALVLEAGVAPPPAPTDSRLWACILLSCLLSVLYNLASFSLLALTSALTVHVLGNLTVVGNLILSRLLFGSRLSTLSYVGIALTLSGMFLYHNCEFVASWAARRGFWRRDQPGKGL